MFYEGGIINVNHLIIGYKCYTIFKYENMDVVL